MAGKFQLLQKKKIQTVRLSFPKFLVLSFVLKSKILEFILHDTRKRDCNAESPKFKIFWKKLNKINPKANQEGKMKQDGLMAGSMEEC